MFSVYQLRKNHFEIIAAQPNPVYKISALIKYNNCFDSTTKKTSFHPVLSSAASVLALASLTSNAQNITQNGVTQNGVHSSASPTEPKNNSISQFALDRFSGKTLNL